MDVCVGTAASERLGIIAICRGSIGVNQELGLRSAVEPDQDHMISEAFEVPSMPAAVLIGARRIVASADQDVGLVK